MALLNLSTEAWNSLLPLIIITGSLLLSMAFFAIRNAVKGAIRYARVDGYETFFLNDFLLNWWLWLFEPFGKLMVRFNVSPNVISYLQLPVALAASVLFAMGDFGSAGWIVCFGATLDYVDGMVAKNSNRVTRSGGFLDSTLDRYVDFLILIGYIAYYRHSTLWILPALALLGSTAVPYMRAKGESLGVQSQVGGMQRAERVFFLGFFGAISPIVAAFVEPRVVNPIFHAALIGIVIVAVFSNVTATLRARHIMRELDKQDSEN